MTAASNGKAVYDVIVIGAGPGGLTTAYTLLKNDPKCKVLVLEKDPRYVGGISRTVEHNGYRFDIGGHRFFSKSQEIVDLWHEILPDDFIQRPRLSHIYYNKKFYTYPLRAVEAFIKLGPITSGFCVLSYLHARVFPVKNPKSFHDWVRNQFGERLFRIFFKTYTEKVWGMSCDEISADWAAQRIKGLNLMTAVINALANSLGLGKKKKGKDGSPKTLISSFEYPRLGPGMMWAAATEKIRAKGGEIRMGAEVNGLRKTADGWVVQSREGGGTREYEGRHVVSSAPMRELVKSVQPRPKTAETVDKLQYRDFITVAVMLSRPPSFEDNWIYIHDPGVKVGRVQNFTSWSPDMVPKPGLGCLGLEYFCFEGDNLWNSDDAALAALARKELMHIGLAEEKDFIDFAVVRQHKAYPVYDQGYKDVVAKVVDEFRKDYPGLHFVGRNGMHKYNNQDHAMMTGILTAENILAGKEAFDVWNVNEDAEYHEEGNSAQQGRRHALQSVHDVPAAR
jgi:protoporphyrinogen oxidase